MTGTLVLSVLVGTAATAASGWAAPPGAPAKPEGPPLSQAAPVEVAAPAPGQLVTRKGPRARPTVTANPGGFSAAAPVKFGDGVTLRVDKVAAGAEQGEGPGVLHGTPNTAVTLTLVNGSPTPLDLTQVVVATTYGTPAKAAQPVYTDDAVDFTGTVPPGGTATATYVFAVPPAQARTAVTTVDFADTHVAATFSGLG